MQTAEVKRERKPRPQSFAALQKAADRRRREGDIAKRLFQESVREIIAKAANKREIFPRLAGRFDIDEETWSAYLALPEDKI